MPSCPFTRQKRPVPDLIKIEPDPLSDVEDDYMEHVDIDRGDVSSNLGVKVRRHVTVEHPTALKSMKQEEAKNVNFIDIYNSNGITEDHFYPRYCFLRLMYPHITFSYNPFCIGYVIKCPFLFTIIFCGPIGILGEIIA